MEPQNTRSQTAGAGRLYLSPFGKVTRRLASGQKSVDTTDDGLMPGNTRKVAELRLMAQPNSGVVKLVTPPTLTPSLARALFLMAQRSSHTLMDTAGEKKLRTNCQWSTWRARCSLATPPLQPRFRAHFQPTPIPIRDASRASSQPRCSCLTGSRLWQVCSSKSADSLFHHTNRNCCSHRWLHHQYRPPRWSP